MVSELGSWTKINKNKPTYFIDLKNKQIKKFHGALNWNYCNYFVCPHIPTNKLQPIHTTFWTMTPGGHSPEKQVRVCLKVKTPFSHLSHHSLDPHLQHSWFSSLDPRLSEKFKINDSYETNSSNLSIFFSSEAQIWFKFKSISPRNVENFQFLWLNFHKRYQFFRPIQHSATDVPTQTKVECAPPLAIT